MAPPKGGRHSAGWRWPWQRQPRGKKKEESRPTERLLTPPPPPGHPDLGPRRVALQRRKKDERKKQTVAGAVAVAAALAVAVLVAGSLASGGRSDAEPPRAALEADGQDRITTTLLFGTREGQRNLGGEALWMSLLSYNAQEGTGSIVYIPAHTAAEVPGRGLQGVGDSLGSGGIPLLLVSTENLLGLSIDRYVELSDRDARVLFGALGPLSVDVPEEVRVAVGNNKARLIFDEGLQRLSGHFLVELLYTRGLESDDVELGTRHLAFWDALFETYRDDPEALQKKVLATGGALAESDSPPVEHAAFLRAFAELESDDVTVATLPVSQVGVGGAELYEADHDEIAAFIDETIGTVARDREQVRVQVLNGNGAPGIGQEVAKKLVGEGFRILLGGNARSLDYERTLIITYDPSPRGQALAEKAKELLGVGQVQVSAQQQGIVDLTIVVGKDFLQTLDAG